MKKRSIILAIGIFAVLLAVIAVLVQENRTHTYIGGARWPRSSETMSVTVTGEKDFKKLEKLSGLKRLDLLDSELTVEQFRTLQAALPDCEILWNVPFQGGRVRSDTAELTVTSLSPEDLAALAYFPKLTVVHGEGCTDYEQLLALGEAFPGVTVSYTVALDGIQRENDAKILTVKTAAPDQVAAALRYLPEVREVNFLQTVEPQALLQLRADYPDIAFTAKIDICGVTVRTDAAAVDLSGVPMENTEALEQALPCMENLKKVDMCGCGISDEEMDALNKRHEGVQFVWIVQIGFIPTRTDATTFMPAREGYQVTTQDCEKLRYCTELIALDLGHMKITNCEFVRQMPHLKYLILADTLVKDFSPLTELKELVFLEMFLTDPDDFTPLLSLSALEDLNIGYTFSEHPEIIGQMTWLKHMWWPGGAYYSTTLYELLPQTTMCFHGLSSTGNGWRELQNYYDMRDIFGMPYFVG